LVDEDVPEPTFFDVLAGRTAGQNRAEAAANIF
jgi:hypothetical protein